MKASPRRSRRRPAILPSAGVALEIDSFGGEVAGVFDLADRIRALRRDKPVWAFVAEHAFSAGYALASQATASCCRAPARWAASVSWSCMPI